MTYLLIILMTVLLAIPNILFRGQNAEAGIQPNTELNIGLSLKKNGGEKSLEMNSHESLPINEPTLKMENWMMDLREWNQFPDNDPQLLHEPSIKR
ncbi:MAG: hypothetical protein IH594_10990 [Bacteroidales bacterium]|nr:hypothetical protein [Bacteroidales bacterium]